MIIKFLFVFVIVVSYLLIRHDEENQKRYFFIAILCSVIRAINVPLIGDVVPAALMFWVLFIDYIRNNIDLIKSWKLYTLILLLSLSYGAFQYEIYRVISWENPLWIVMIVAILAPIFIKSETDLQKYMKYILIVCFIFSFSAIISYWGFYDGVILYHIDHGDFMGISRIYGISYSNLVQTISVICICILPFVNISNLLKYVLIAIFAYAAIITLKRMSLIALLLSICYYLFITYKQKEKNSIWIVLIMAAIIVQMQLLDFVLNRFDIFSSNSDRITDHSAYSRVYRIQLAMKVFKSHPLWGGGAGSVIYIHNGFIEILANCGIIGVMTVFMRYLYPLKGLLNFNPWSFMTLIYLVTCLSLEASISRVELMIFLGLFIGGFAVSENLNIDYKRIISENDDYTETLNFDEHEKYE